MSLQAPGQRDSTGAAPRFPVVLCSRSGRSIVGFPDLRGRGWVGKLVVAQVGGMGLVQSVGGAVSDVLC